MKSGIYKITNIVNGKFYIGSSKNIDFRWNDHKQWLRGNYHNNPKLQHAWNKYGEDKFTFEIIEETDADQKTLFERENHYLSTLKPYERIIGYNICPKAEGGDLITYNPNRDQFIEKMKIINHGESNGMFGKFHSKESVNKMKQKSIGRYTLDWFIAKYGTNKGLDKFKKRNEMLKNRKINYSYDNGMTGKKRGPMSEEIKKRISERKHHLNKIREELHKDIISELFTIPQLESKYGTSKATILRERRKLINN
jgi:group I intron endonuclease